MNVLPTSHPLFDQLILWVQTANFLNKQRAFQLIKRTALVKDIKRIYKNNYQSVKKTVDDNTTYAHTNYVSIKDFKPIETNYTSVQIFDHQSNNNQENTPKIIKPNLSHKQFRRERDLQDWMVRLPSRFIQPQNYTLSELASNKIVSYSDEALNCLKKFTFDQFLKSALCKKTAIFKVNYAYSLRYRKSGISNSLTKLPEQQQWNAIATFEELLQAGGQIQTQRHYLLTISKIVQKIWTANDSLKEQLFLQLIKQLSSGKSIYMRIFCCVCYFVKPSTKIYIPLLSFLYEEADLYQRYDKQMLNFCFFCLIKNFEKERRYLPSLFEFYCAFNQRKIPIIVSFPKQQVFFVQPFTTIQDFLRELVDFYELDKEISYLIDINGWLMERGLLLDQFNGYGSMNQTEYQKWNSYVSFKGYYATIALKNSEDIHYSQKCFNLFYNYCTAQYLRGLYYVSKQEFIKISALKMLSEVQDEQNYPFSYKNFTPSNLQSKIRDDQKLKYLARILRQYYVVRDMSVEEARKSIMGIMDKYKGHSSHYFQAHLFPSSWSDKKTWVGIQKDNLIVVQQFHRRIIRKISFSSISQWGVSSSELCLKIDEIGQLHIQANNLDVLVSVFENYLNYQANLLNLI